MLIETTKTKNFHLHDVNQCKLELLLSKALKIRELKNNISNSIILEDITTLTKFDFIKKFNTQLDDVSGQEVQIALSTVYDLYTNKIESSLQKCKFKIQKELKIERFKKKFNNKQVGDIKSVELIMQENNLTKVLTYLARFYNDGLIDYVIKQSTNQEIDDKKRKMYLNIAHYYNKFGQRLINLAKSKHESTVEKCFNKKIEFKSLSYRSINQFPEPIVDWNPNKDSIFNVFIKIKRTNKVNDFLIFPTKYALDYHEEIIKYQKGAYTSYSVVFDNNKLYKISIPIDSQEEIITDKTGYIGVDTNMKHNLFYTSTNQQIDFDREEFEQYTNFLKHLDEKKSTNKDSKELSNHDKKHYNHYKVKITNMIKRKCSELVDLAIKEGRNHIVLEDLDQFAKSFGRIDELNGLKLTRLTRLLNISNIKNIIKSIAGKNGLQVSFIHAYYTSQTCPHCGCVDRLNRQSQEIFKCIHCGYESNADFNAGENIYNRMFLDVLRNRLMTKNSYGEYEPKKVNKQFVINELYSYYSGLKTADEDLIYS